MSKAQELKPCAFCGECTAQPSSNGVENHMMVCECGAEGPPAEDDDAALAAWNRRAPASSEQQAARQDEERDQEIGRAVQRACADLPEGCEVVIHLEKGAGTVYMTDWDGNEYDHFQSDDGFGDVINQAVDGAITADAAARASNGGKAND